MTSEDRRRLAQLESDIRAGYAHAEPRWSTYGGLMHYGSEIDLDDLLASNRLENAVARGAIDGWDPDLAALEELTELQRLADAQAKAVWVRSGS